MDSGTQHFALTGMSEMSVKSGCGSFYKGKLAVWILSWLHQPGIQTTCADVLFCPVLYVGNGKKDSIQEQNCS